MLPISIANRLLGLMIITPLKPRWTSIEVLRDLALEVFRTSCAKRLSATEFPV